MEISQLFIYPVKSLRGIRVTQAELTPLGLRFDRHWMIINDKDQFVTQRKHPRMVLVKTKLDNDYLYLSSQGMEDLKISLAVDTDQLSNTTKATIWNDECTVTIENDIANQWITDALESKKPLRLVRMADGHQRPQSKAERFGENNTTQFADAVAYLLCHESSLDRLNESLTEKQLTPCDIEQFRPNIVIKNSLDKEQPTLAAFQEHQVQKFANSHYGFISCDPCQRCIMPTINLLTAIKDPQQEPYKSLVQLNPMPDNPKAPAFGQNLTLLSKSIGQTITVGDEMSFIV